MNNTTVFITRSWKSIANKTRIATSSHIAQRVMGHFTSLFMLLLTSVVSIVFAFPVTCQAEGVTLQSVKIEATEDGLQINADYDFQLTSTMLETVRKGVPLYFVVEVELTRARWYWLDDVVIRASRDRRVSYVPLTEQFRLTTSGISQQVNTAEEVRRFLSRVRSWNIAEKGKLKPGEKYDAAIRFRLDTSQLPKPFQLNTIGSKEWNLSSDWHHWTFVAGKDEK